MSNIIPLSQVKVRKFVAQMEGTAQENDYKGEWKQGSIDQLVLKLVEEVGEVCELVLEGKMHCGGYNAVKEDLIKSATEVANVAMMIVNIAERLSR